MAVAAALPAQATVRISALITPAKKPNPKPPKLSREVSYFLSGDYLTACDLGIALARLFPAVIRGDVKPRTAHTVAYLAQTLAQTIHLAQHEYVNSFGTEAWRRTVRNSVNQNSEYRKPSPPGELEETPSPSQPPHLNPNQTTPMYAPGFRPVLPSPHLLRHQPLPRPNRQPHLP